MTSIHTSYRLCPKEDDLLCTSPLDNQIHASVPLKLVMTTILGFIQSHLQAQFEIGLMRITFGHDDQMSRLKEGFLKLENLECL